MFCIVAFVVLGILGIFSATRRELAREALNCVFRRVTLRPCDTGFDEKMKARILGRVITRSEAAARLLNKNFELLSWVFFILMLGSSVWVVSGSYVYYVTGSCSGLNRTAFCIFDPRGRHNEVSTVADSCPVKPTTIADVTLKDIHLTGFPMLHAGAKGRIVMVGCYGCDYSRKVYPILKELVNKSNANFIFLNYPVKVKSDLMTRVGLCVYQRDPARYWKLNDILFTTNKANLDDAAYAQKTVTDLGLDSAGINRCVTAPVTENLLNMQLNEITKTNFYGTPTVFIDGEVFVGSKPYRVYAIALKGLLYWLK
jgi:hypothetical protein